MSNNFSSRRDDPYWSENKKLSLDTDARFGHGSDYRQQSRFLDFSHRERARFPDTTSVQSSSFERSVDTAALTFETGALLVTAPVLCKIFVKC